MVMHSHHQQQQTGGWTGGPTQYGIGVGEREHIYVFAVSARGHRRGPPRPCANARACGLVRAPNTYIVLSLRARSVALRANGQHIYVLTLLVACYGPLLYLCPAPDDDVLYCYWWCTSACCSGWHHDDYWAGVPVACSMHITCSAPVLMLMD